MDCTDLDAGEKISHGEEIANAVTHGAGLLLSIAGFVALLLVSVQGTIWQLIGCTIYGATLVLLYAASTCYHSCRSPGTRKFFRAVDHCCIYLLIAGTYTPFTLTLMRGGWGWTLFGLVWSIAAAGIVFKTFFTGRFEFLSTLAYVLMGWLIVIALKPFIEHVPFPAIMWLLAGGLLYTGGVLFYHFDRIRYFHAIWHLFVLAGSICQFCAVMFYVAV